MRPEVQQAFALCSHGNAFLRSPDSRPAEMLGVHPSFDTTFELRLGVNSPRGFDLVADRVVPWLRRLHTEDVSRLRLITEGVPQFGPIPDDLKWGILADGDRGLHLWRPTWTKRYGGYHNPRPYLVTYTGNRFSRWSLPLDRSWPEARTSLILAVKDLIVHGGSAGWTAPLRRCLDGHWQGGTAIRALVPQPWPDEINDLLDLIGVFDELLSEEDLRSASEFDEALAARCEAAWVALRQALESASDPVTVNGERLVEPTRTGLSGLG